MTITTHTNHTILDAIFCETCGVILKHDTVDQVNIIYTAGPYLESGITKFKIQWSGQEVSHEWVKKHFPDFYVELEGPEVK